VFLVSAENFAIHDLLLLAPEHDVSHSLPPPPPYQTPPIIISAHSVVLEHVNSLTKLLLIGQLLPIGRNLEDCRIWFSKQMRSGGLCVPLSI
jgi:hypothetical protein